LPFYQRWFVNVKKLVWENYIDGYTAKSINKACKTHLRNEGI